MKCPKCSYLGFETGDRCKNCGYDFSLIDSSPSDDLNLTLPDTFTPTTTPAWAAEVDRALRVASFDPIEPAAPEPDPVAAPPAPAPARPPAAMPMPTAQSAAPLPLFTPAADDEDEEPLIKLPASPRPPLAVRKTPDIPRLRAVPRPARVAEPALEFADVAIADDMRARVPNTPTPDADVFRAVPQQADGSGSVAEPSTAGARLAAAALDHLILAGIDAGVIYLTLRLAELTMAGWALLPLAPLVTFLLLVKVSYLCAFTAIGGQTIGKMAMGIRVVTEDGGPVDGVCAIRRTLAGTVSAIALGLGFLPALIGSERRALHDHLAHTRVVDLHSA